MMDEIAYAATHRGAPGFCAFTVDDPAYAKQNAKLIAGWIARGDIVTRVRVSVVRTGMAEYIAWRDAQPGASKELL